MASKDTSLARGNVADGACQYQCPLTSQERSALNLAQQLIYNRKSPEAANAKWTDVNAAGWCELNNIVVEELEAAAVYQRAFARNDELVARLHDMESRIETLCSHA